MLEIRGVGGATAGEILGGDVTQTAGDELAGFYRPDDPQTRPTEAYEWGKLTSGSRTSALWWILFPFTLINVAGWLFRPTATELGRSDEPRRSFLWFSRLVIVGGGLAELPPHPRRDGHSAVPVPGNTADPDDEQITRQQASTRQGVGCAQLLAAPIPPFGSTVLRRACRTRIPQQDPRPSGRWQGCRCLCTFAGNCDCVRSSRSAHC